MSIFSSLQILVLITAQLNIILAKGGIQIIPRLQCTKNEYNCVLDRKCIDYNGFCTRISLYSTQCHLDQPPLQICKDDGLNSTAMGCIYEGQTHVTFKFSDFNLRTSCVCPTDTVFNTTARACEAIDKCSATLKDRYCDQICSVNKASAAVSCSCDRGFSPQTIQINYGAGNSNYTKCIPDSTSAYGEPYLVVSGLSSDNGWQKSTDFIFTDASKHYLKTISKRTVIPRLNIRSTEHVIKKIYAITSNTISSQKFLSEIPLDGALPVDYKIPYTLNVLDFAIDWPSGYVYYLSKNEPKLLVCTTNNQFCRILPLSLQLAYPREIILDSHNTGYLIILDGSKIIRMSLDADMRVITANVNMDASHLTIDFSNSYLFYLNPSDKSIYRLNYQTLDSKTVPQKLYTITTLDSSKESISAMSAIGSYLYLATSFTRSSGSSQTIGSKIYRALSTNPHLVSEQPEVLASGPGNVTGLLAVHESSLRTSNPRPQSECHFMFGDRCVCMEGYTAFHNNTCVRAHLESTTSLVLFVSRYRGMILAQQIPAGSSSACIEPIKITSTIPITPVQHIGEGIVGLAYDPVRSTIYFSTVTGLHRRDINATSIHAEEFKVSPYVGGDTVIYGSINPSERTILLGLTHHPAHPLNFYIVNMDKPSSRFDYDALFSLKLSRDNQTGYDLWRLHFPSGSPAYRYGTEFTSGRQSIKPAPSSILSVDAQQVLYSVSTYDSVISCPGLSYISNLLYINMSAKVPEPPSYCKGCDDICYHYGPSYTEAECVCSPESVSSNITTRGTCYQMTTEKCSNNQVLCSDKVTCINRTSVCDGIVDCPTHEDEMKDLCKSLIPSCQENPDGLMCNTSSSNNPVCLPHTYLCDGYKDCIDGEDEANCNKLPVCNGVVCPFTDICIDSLSVCDGVADCPGTLYDETRCQSCQREAFYCEAGRQCIEQAARCDGHVDCFMALDEQNCTKSNDSDINAGRRCGPLEFQCKNGQCIPSIWRCDNSTDCADYSDEMDCSLRHCPSPAIRCNSTGKCIQPEWICDGQPDCLDEEDEEKCNVTCNFDQFKCQDIRNPDVTICIDLIKVCDSFPDCAHRADESDVCDSHACYAASCSHDCVIDPSADAAYRCICPIGMYLTSNGTCLPDTRTCDQWGVCSQECTKLSRTGDIKCYCHDDYFLDSDMFTCHHDAGGASLIFSSRHELKLLATEPSSVYSVLISSLRNTIAVDFHYEKNYVFWSDVIADKIYRGTRETNTTTGSLYDIVEIITSGLPTAEGIAVDWIGNHIYWVDSGLDIIEVADLDGSNRSTIISSSAEYPLENPRSLAVDPREGLLFWADWGIKQIKRSTMAGTDQTKLFEVNDHLYNPNGGWANGLSLDYDTKRVYWIDAKSDTIQTVDYNGQDFHTVLYGSELLKHPFAISVFENWVYWSDWRTNSINRANKWNGSNAELVQSTFTQPFDLKVLHKGRQPPLAGLTDQCSVNNGGCSHLCLRVSPSEVTCACPHHYHLDITNNQTCKAITKFLLLAASDNLRGISLTESKSHGIMPTISAPLIERVYMVDYYMVNGDDERLIFWADSGLGTIASAELSGMKPKNVLDLPSEVEFEFAIDYINRRLYFVTYSLKDADDGAINVCEFDGSRRATITTGLHRPKGILLVPDEGIMYVIDEGANSIYKLYMNGLFYTGDKTTSNIVADHSDIQVRGFKMSHVQLDGMAELYIGNSSYIAGVSSQGSLTVYYNHTGSPYIVWTIADNSGLYYVQSTSADQSHELYAVLLDNDPTAAVTESETINLSNYEGSQPVDIKLVQYKTVDDDMRVKCESCNHYCLPRGGKTTPGTCVCYSGYKYDSGYKRCLAVDELLLYASRAPQLGIFGLDLYSQSNRSILAPIPQVFKPAAIDYYSAEIADSDGDYIYWIDSGHTISRSKRDLTNRSTIISGLIAARDLAVDPGTGNLFWLDSFSGTIEVSRSDGSCRVILYQKDGTQLTSLALHPAKGYVYFIDRIIKRVQLGGPTPAVDSTDVVSSAASALAIDWTNDLLYYCNESGIWRCDLDGVNLTSVLSSSTHDAFTCTGIAVSDEYVYYAINTLIRTEAAQIWYKSMASTTEQPVKLAAIGGSVTDLALASKQRHFKLDTNPCTINNGGCQDLCLFGGDRTRSSHCLCSIGRLDTDGKSCIKLQEFLVFSRINTIEFLSLNATRDNHMSSTITPAEDANDKMMNVIAVATDSDRKRVYYSDIQRRALSWISYERNETGDILTDADPIEGMYYDNNKIYFTQQAGVSGSEPRIATVDVASTNYPVKAIVRLRKLDAPRAIAVHTCKGYVFWTNWNELSPSIQRSETTGAQLINIISDNIVIPNGLALDYQAERLYWADANLDKIEKCDFDGHECVIFLSQVSPHIFALALHGNFLYWTDWMQRSVGMAHKLDGTFNMTLVSRLPRQPMGIAVASNVTCEVSPCYQSDCEQRCTVIGNGLSSSCSCFEGYELSADLKSCTPMNITTDDCKDGFKCATDCLPWELTCDRVNHCPPSGDSVFPADEDPHFCAVRKCPVSKYITCLNLRCVSVDKICDGVDDCGDFTDEMNCSSTTCNASSQFQCKSGQCIPKENYCDGLPHCWDKSDELPPNCTESGSVFVDCKKFDHPFYGTITDGFKCPHTPVCIISDWLCDGHNDCWDNSDELDCQRPACNEPDEWPCKGGNSQANNIKQCILASWVCDGEADCTDGSDEMDCELCPPGQWSCTDKRTCIPQSMKCDGRNDCYDASDEFGCQQVQNQTGCLSSQFTCADGIRCLPQSFVCDGEPDCLDGSDEHTTLGCPVIECGPQEVKCNNSRCIDIAFVCDGIHDCLDGSDEPTSCSYKACDFRSEFTCSTSSNCIPLSSRCDQWPDCTDGSDEDDRNCPHPLDTGCPPGRWQCPDGQCISEALLCNGQADCADSADEFSCNINECAHHNGGCNQLCEDQIVSYRCGCFQGFKLINNRTCIDIDECEESNDCSQRCLNIPQSYHCTCAYGYKMVADKKSCKPKFGVPAYLLVTNKYYIRNMSLEHMASSGNASQQSIITSSLVNAVGLDYDYRQKKIYWTDVTNNVHSISRMDFNGSNIEKLHWSTLNHPDGLAVDWVGGNLYWSDNIKNTIEVSKLNGQYRKVLKFGIKEPRALQLHPAKGYLYYTDWSQEAHIGRMGMDGSGYKVLITESLGWPNALAIDIYAEKLYFGDAKLDYIAMTDLDGKNRRMVVHNDLHHIYSLAVYEKSLYWSDWNKMQVVKADKFTGANRTVLAELVHRPMEIRIVQEVLQMTQGLHTSNPCDSLDCEALCLLRPSASGLAEAVCACPEYATLLPDRTSCMSSCRFSQFQCTNELKCLHFTQRCDGSQDCLDGSDEALCDDLSSLCPPYTYTCKLGNNQTETLCLNPSKLCDGKRDCFYGDDEKIYEDCSQYTCLEGYFLCQNQTNSVCLSPQQICSNSEYSCQEFNHTVCALEERCEASEFQCKSSGKCIPLVHRCDDHIDCMEDGSDESSETCVSSAECLHGYVSCNNSGQCIPESWQCDGSADCANKYDESSDVCSGATCPPTFFQCGDRKCIPERWYCDFEADCLDHSDEIDCTPRLCSEAEWACPLDFKCIHLKQKCDGKRDCGDGSDEMSCNNNKTCDQNHYKCDHVGGDCIPLSWKCDNIADCEDLSDERDCPNRKCERGMFACKNSLCIPETFRCDGQDDCIDGSDELLCDNHTCLPDRFRCSNSKCIPVVLLCDGNDDCGDNSDENKRNCPNRCKEGSFQCADGSCLPNEKVCNGVVDCPRQAPVTKLCSNRRPDGTCLDFIEDDEINSEFVCLKQAAGCTGLRFKFQTLLKLYPGDSNRLCKSMKSTVCEDIKGSMINITCDKGYEVNVTSALDFCNVCIDTNECEKSGYCSQLCNNTAGSYTCSCEEGFHIVDTKLPGLKHECVLNDEEEYPYLLMAIGQTLKSVDLKRGQAANNQTSQTTRPSFESFINETSRIDSLAFNANGDKWKAYMLSYHTKSILEVDISSLYTQAGQGARVKRASSVINMSGKTPRQQQQSTEQKTHSFSVPQTIKTGIHNPSSIVYDWRHNNLYWTDTVNATITMLSLNTSLEATIVSIASILTAVGDRHYSPQAIAIDPVISARIFWTDCCIKPRIWSADLDGTNPQVLTEDVAWPGGITCDVSNQRVYWTDSKHKTINSISTGGKEQVVVHTFEEFQPYRIDVFGRNLYVTSFNRSSIVTLHKFMNKRENFNESMISYITSQKSVGDIIVLHRRKGFKPAGLQPPLCACSNQTIATETYHDGDLRCSCVCPNDWHRINVSHCSYCPCMNGGICSNSPDQPVQCVCPTGFSGSRCQLTMCEDYCDPAAVCEMIEGQPFCHCPLHLTGSRCEIHKCSGFACQGTECWYNKTVGMDCGNGVCRVDDGGLTYCQCNIGYTGEHCDQLSGPCAQCGNRSISCDRMGLNEYRCLCKSGFQGRNCELCHFELSKLTTGCHGNGYCQFNSDGSPYCTCYHENFNASSMCGNSLCRDKCLNGGSCSLDKRIDGTIDTKCSCPKYFTGSRCERRTTCITNYCHNGGTCYVNPVDHESQPAVCSCHKDFAGDFCEKMCTPACEPGYQCTISSTDETLSCECPLDRYGDQCQYWKKCRNHCLNGGECVGCFSNRTIADCDECCNCRCQDAWTGTRCEERVDRVEVPSSSSTSMQTVGIVCGIVGLLLVIAVIIALIFYRRKRRRDQLFSHLRLSDEASGLHVTNPMYSKALDDDDNEPMDEDDDYSVYSAGDTSNFANPLYKLTTASRKNNSTERSALLVDEDD